MCFKRLLVRLLMGYLVLWGISTADAATVEIAWQGTVYDDNIVTGDLLPTGDGGYLIAGSRYNSGNLDVHLEKLDRSGNKKWERTYGGSGQELSSVVQPSIDGGYLIAGSTDSFNALFGGIYLLKIDRNGSREWEKAILSNHFTAYARNVLQNPDGSWIITGSGGGHTILVKTDAAGNKLWERELDGVCGETVVPAGDGGYVVSGKGTNGKGSYSAYLVKTDEAGQQEWSTDFTGCGETGRLIYQKKDGGYLMVASGADETSNIYLAKTDSDGEIQWRKTLDIGPKGIVSSLARTSDEGWIVCLRVTDGTSDFKLVKVDKDGARVWEKLIGSGFDKFGGVIKQTGDGGYLLTARRFSQGLMLLLKIAPEMPDPKTVPASPGRSVSAGYRIAVPSFKQANPAFSGVLGYGPDSIAQSGCAVTALSMVLNYYGVKTTPRTLNDQLLKTGGFWWDAGLKRGTALLSWTPASIQAVSGGKVSETLNIRAADAQWPLRWNIIDRELRNKRPVIVKLSRDGDITGHYVVIVGKQGPRYLVNDPATGEAGILLEKNYLSKPDAGVIVSTQHVVQVLTFTEK